MKSVCKFMAAAATFVAFSVPAVAQDLVTYDTVGVWAILVDPAVGNGCLINAEFEDGSDVRIGFENNGESGYLMAMNKAWEGIEDGTEYPITIDVDGSAYEGSGTGLHLDGLPGVDISFDTVDFLMDVALKQTLTLSNEEGEVMSIDLADSHSALEAAIACQEAQE